MIGFRCTVGPLNHRDFDARGHRSEDVEIAGFRGRGRARVAQGGRCCPRCAGLLALYVVYGVSADLCVCDAQARRALESLTAFFSETVEAFGRFVSVSDDAGRGAGVRRTKSKHRSPSAPSADSLDGSVGAAVESRGAAAPGGMKMRAAGIRKRVHGADSGTTNDAKRKRVGSTDGLGAAATGDVHFSGHSREFVGANGGAKAPNIRSHNIGMRRGARLRSAPLRESVVPMEAPLPVAVVPSGSPPAALSLPVGGVARAGAPSPAAAGAGRGTAVGAGDGDRSKRVRGDESASDDSHHARRTAAASGNGGVAAGSGGSGGVGIGDCNKSSGRARRRTRAPKWKCTRDIALQVGECAAADDLARVTAASLMCSTAPVEKRTQAVPAPAVSESPAGEAVVDGEGAWRSRSRCIGFHGRPRQRAAPRSRTMTVFARSPSLQVSARCFWVAPRMCTCQRRR